MHSEPGNIVTPSIERIAGALAMGEALAATGRAVDLAGLDAAIGALCSDALALPRAQGRACLPALGALLERVEALRIAMHRARPPD